MAGGEQDVVAFGQQLDADQTVGRIGLLVAIVALHFFGRPRAEAHRDLACGAGCW